MENGVHQYRAIYREWRPKTFGDIVGQDAVTTALKNQILSGRIAHAYLFCGSRGTGKTTTARVFARAVNCLSPVDGYEPCGKCEMCRDILADTCMDVVEIDAASNNSVDQIRDLRDKVVYPPAKAKKKVYIIDEVHQLSSGAFNALLKTLEEPPEHALFLLATTDPGKLPATVLSRCQRFDLKRYSVQVLAKQLRKVVDGEGVSAQDEALFEIARAASGGMRDALSLLEMCMSFGAGELTLSGVREAIGTSSPEFLFSFAEALIGDDVAAALKAVDDSMLEGRDPRSLAGEMTSHLRDLMLIKAMGTVSEEDAAEILECTLEDAGNYLRQAARAESDKLMRMMELFMRVEAEMKDASLPQTRLEMCVFLCCRPSEQLRLDALAERVTKLEKRLEEGVFVKKGSEDVPPPPEEEPPFDMPEEFAQPAQTTKDIPVEGTRKQQKKQANMPDPVWERALNELCSENPSLAAMLPKAVFLGRENGMVTLGFEKKNNMYMRILDTDAKKALIAAKLSAIYGENTTVAVIQSDTAGKPDPAERTDTIILARDIFGRENVEIMEE